MTWNVPVVDNIDSFILLADTTKVVKKVSTRGTPSGGFWVSPSYARGQDLMTDYTVKRISFRYIVNTLPANVKVYIDPDGTAAFVLVKQVTLAIPAAGGVLRADVFPDITGPDPRVKLEMNPTGSTGVFVIRSLEVQIIERPRP